MQAKAQYYQAKAQFYQEKAEQLIGGGVKPPRQPPYPPHQQQFIPHPVGVQWYGYGYGNGMLALGGNPVVFAQRQGVKQIVVPQQQVQDLYVLVDGALTKATGEMPQHFGLGHYLTLLDSPFLSCRICCCRVPP
jgi:hypothetical protein